MKAQKCFFPNHAGTPKYLCVHLKTIIKTRKLTLTQYYYLIYRPYSVLANCPNYVTERTFLIELYPGYMPSIPSSLALKFCFLLYFTCNPK